MKAQVGSLGVALALAAASSLGLAACSKNEPAAAADAGAASTASSAPAAAASADAGAAGTSATAAPAGARRAYTGAFTAQKGTLYVPDHKDWSTSKFRGEESDVGLGAGTLELEVDPSGVARGTSKGALGEGIVSGLREGSTLVATFTPKTDDGPGFVGTIRVELAEGGASGKGTLEASSATGGVLREAAVTLAAK